MLRIALVSLCTLPLAACTGIPRGWQQARQNPTTGPDGAWVGTWRSDVNGHTGGLRAVVTPVCADTSQRDFRFRASWAKILCAGFDLQAAVKPSGPGTWTVTGSRDLGRLFGGTFTCTGTFRGDVFQARYGAKMDHGIMEMRRVRATP